MGERQRGEQPVVVLPVAAGRADEDGRAARRVSRVLEVTAERAHRNGESGIQVTFVVHVVADLVLVARGEHEDHT